MKKSFRPTETAKILHLKIDTLPRLGVHSSKLEGPFWVRFGRRGSYRAAEPAAWLSLQPGIVQPAKVADALPSGTALGAP
jgi:hypothetical protein